MTGDSARLPPIDGRSPILCLVTDRVRYGGDRLIDLLEAAVAGGVNLVQVREKDLSDPSLADLVDRIRARLAGRAWLFVNGRPEVAATAGADGVHLPESVATPLPAMRLRVGRSVHSVESARSAAVDAAYLLAGPIYTTASHPGHAAAGPELIRAIRAAVSVPIVAIGGIDAARVDACIEAGASGVAVISAIGAAQDPEAAAHALSRRLTAARERRSAREGEERK